MIETAAEGKKSGEPQRRALVIMDPIQLGGTCRSAHHSSRPRGLYRGKVARGRRPLPSHGLAILEKTHAELM